MEILKIENLSFKYPLCGENALKNISFAVQKGEFIVVCGATGSGKSTLLRMLKEEISPLGEKTGTIHINSSGKKVFIGYVMQKPEQQIVTDKVWHELAFGLENMNLPENEIAAKIAETASYLGIESLFEKKVSELSGGQKQILNLASVMAMNPDVLVLDEPTSQLDPIAASDFIETVKRLNRELSLTVIMAEHRLEDVIPVCDKLLVMEKGTVSHFAEPSDVIGKLCGRPELLCAMPMAARLYMAVDLPGKCPLSVSDGRRFIETHFENRVKCLPKNQQKEKNILCEKTVLEFKNVFFAYGRHMPDVLRDLDFKAYENEIFCILGGNGSGKTTALAVSAGLLKPYSGEVKVFGKNLREYKNQSLYRECIAYLPQDVQTVFLKNTVEEELNETKADIDMLPYDIKHLLDKHPYDLSGGEQQLVAIAKVLALKPKILLLDEPTKGIDAYAKHSLAHLLKKLKEQGMTIVTVTHDAEFAALCADRCALFFRGQVMSACDTVDFFSGNNFYTTAVSRMTRGYYDKTVTLEDAAEICFLNLKGAEQYDSDKK